MSSAPFALYGATGYTGRLIVEHAVARGHQPLLLGRDAVRLGELGARFGLRYREVSLHESDELGAVLRRVPVLLNAAGPFSVTAAPLLAACLATGTHYTDVTGEVQAIESAAARNADARDRGIMVMPAIGFDVVPSDCLAAHVARRLPEASTLRLGLRGLEHLSRGSARTIIQQLGRGVWVRRGGRLRTVAPGSLRRPFDYGDGPSPSVAVSWGDVASAYFSTGIPNIEVYFAETLPLRGAVAAHRTLGWLLSTAGWQNLLQFNARWLPEGPSAAQRRRTSVTLVAEATADDGRRASARMRTPEVYTFTAASAVHVLERIMKGDAQPGFQTPSRVWGPDFVLSLDGVSRVDT